MMICEVPLQKLEYWPSTVEWHVFETRRRSDHSLDVAFLSVVFFPTSSNFAYISVSLILLQLLTTFHMLECNEWTTSRLLSFFIRKKIASESFQGNLMHL